MITEKDILIKEPKEYIDKVALIAQISFIERSQQRYMSNKLKELNLFLGEVKLIMSICANEGLSQEDLVKTFGLNKSTVANSLRSLEEQGYMETPACDGMWCERDTKQPVKMDFTDYCSYGERKGGE